MQKGVKNLHITTVKLLNHIFGTVRSWKREFTVGEFISHCNKLESSKHKAAESKDTWTVLRVLQIL